MRMCDRRQWDWYQPVAKADANGDHGGHHLHGPRDQAVIGLESQNGVCCCHAMVCCNLAKKDGGGGHVACRYHDISVNTFW